MILLAMRVGFKSDIHRSFIISLFSFFLLPFISDYYLTTIGLSIFIFNLILFIQRLGKVFPILELMLLISSMQWILGPFIAYKLEFSHFKYFMYISEKEYMYYIVPATLLFNLGVLILYKKYDFSNINEKLIEFCSLSISIPLVIIFISLISTVLHMLFPSTLAFLFFLLANLKYVGISYLFFNRNINKYLLYSITFLVMLISSLEVGMFHNLIIWSVLFFSFLVQYKKINKLLITSAFIFGFIFLLLLQSVKVSYRYYLDYSNQDKSKIHDLKHFTELIISNAVNIDELFSTENIGILNVRFNQGWIISAIMQNMPNNQPFLKGETIKNAVYASIVPRFIFPDKPVAGGRENFMKFTGLYLHENTSMGISIVGESYGNFGYTGGIIFMFIWGLFISFIFNILIKSSAKYKTIILWLPLIFLQVIKAETELVVVLNHLIKSSILVFMLLFFFRKGLGVSI